MRLSRRTFMVGTSAACTLPAFPSAAPAPSSLRAEPGTVQLAPRDYAKTPIWGYDGQVPGPTLRVAQANRLQIDFENRLDEASTVHWHGIRIANAMDGVAGLTQTAVEPGGNFLYDFVLPDAGTYWYHPHNRTWEQMARGLYGALIVEESEAPEADHDLVFLIDDWRLAKDGTIDESFGQMHDWSHAGRLGNWITVNGQSDLNQTVRQNDRLRLRLVNTANSRIFRLGVQGLDGWVVALDGQPLATPVALDRLVLAPAQRADLLVDVRAAPNGEALLISHERDGGYALASFTVAPGTSAHRPPPDALSPNPLAEPELQDARAIELTMAGGAMGRMTSAVFEGTDTPIRELVRNGMVWAFNGTAGLPPEPLVTASQGENLRIKMVNDTGWPHAMHLHGHHFRVVGADGALGPWRDTTLLERGETKEIAFVADNVGRWLLHCHMLEHAASGMMTWIEVM